MEDTNCVRHRDGWCAAKASFRDGDSNVDTVCGHVVVLPLGYKVGLPDCPDCLSILGRYRLHHPPEDPAEETE